MSITIRVDNSHAVSRFDALAQSQLPFATAKAVTQTGLDFQKAERARFGRIFTERRQSFLELQGVKLIGGIATKNRPSITFGVDKKASFLDKFETGEPKEPIASKHLELPVLVRKNKRDIIPASNRPRQLLSRDNIFKLDAPRGKLPAGIYQRKAKHVVLLYAAVDSAKTPRILEFAATMAKTAHERWRLNFSAALTEAMRTAR